MNAQTLEFRTGDTLLVWTGGFNDCHERCLITASIAYPPLSLFLSFSM
jgi:hypothetical protein